MAKKNNKIKIQKEDFIEFLSQATPKDINDYILKYGKPRKAIDPIIFYDERENKPSE